MNEILEKIKALFTSLGEAIGLLLKIVGVLFERLSGQRKCKNKQRPSGCFVVPPDVARAPDPCIYSQTYLRAQGLSVTWNNPDIQITTLEGAPVESSELEPDTDYLVVATIHNASFDAALGVEVICVYRPWSFGTEDRVPIETDDDGNAAMRVIHIGAWGASQASFRWRTPALAPGEDRKHYCIQVECYHPADREPNNNLGQENTNIVRTASPATIDIPIQNLKDRRQDIRIEFDEYSIPSDKIVIPLSRIDRAAKTDQRRLLKSSIRADSTARGSIGSARRSAHIRLREETRRGKRERKYTVHSYSHGAELRARNGIGKFPLDKNWELRIDQLADSVITLDPKAEAILKVDIEPNATVAAGSKKQININAINEDGTLLGGVTLTVEAT